MKRIALVLSCLFIALSATAQPETFHVNGMNDYRAGFYAFTNATIYIDYDTKVEDATLIIKDGKVYNTPATQAIPEGAIEVDLTGKHIYPSFIDLYTNYGAPEVKEPEWNGPQLESNVKGAYGWNQAIRAEFDLASEFIYNEKQAEELRKLGFGTVLSHRQDGIARGSGALITLSDRKENETVLITEASAHYSFNKGSSTQDYPGSLMGSIALLRQTYMDADWYTTQSQQVNLSLEAWNSLQELPQIFEANSKLNVLRADELGDEFGVQYIIKTQSDAYQRLNDLKATGASLIVSLNYPKAFDVEDPYDAMLVPLSDMWHWEMAPGNLKMLNEAGITFAITSADLGKEDNFWANLRKAVKYGLSEEAALKALTQTPAELLNAYDKVGSLEKGKLANFIITSGPIFDEKTTIYQNWIQGEGFILKDFDFLNVLGDYELKVGNQSFTLNIGGDTEKPKAKIAVNDSTKVDVDFSRQGKVVTLVFNPDKSKAANYYRLSGMMGELGQDMKGKGQLPNSNWVDWTADYQGWQVNEEEAAEEEAPIELPELHYPFVSYGWTEAPKAEKVLVQNATVWTNEADGILENTDVLIENGKIAAVGQGLSAGGAKVIDGTGKHLTAGIIDEHSHICINGGVNEWTEASSAEVRIGDVVNSEDINMYRQLAGGVTMAQLLHGSANPIGGQSAIVKFRWGKKPEDMKFENAAGFIKFALGENVKQANWGDDNTIRYPQTRMGVEQIYNNYFTKAVEYGEAWGAYNGLSAKDKAKTNPPRRDLELETLLEIIESERFITCHSYVQSEINMLMKVADQFGFTLNTFTHILEGYKVADKMKEHGANASTFSDWWAYKYEVIDAIPYNAALLNSMGINTAINSDDAEMGRRLNQEAAKAVKYGGASEEDAWKMVTLNPAKMLHIDQWVGSIKKGKDADVVLWSDNPLSVYAVAEKTFVDGICYYDVEKDAEMREWIAGERNRLIQAMIDEKKGGAPTQKPTKKDYHGYGCVEGHVH